MLVLILPSLSKYCNRRASQMDTIRSGNEYGGAVIQGVAYPLASRRKRCVDGHDGRDDLDPFNTLCRGEGEKFPQAVQGVDQKTKLRSTIGIKVLGHVFDLVGRVQIDDTQCITCSIDASLPNKSKTVEPAGRQIMDIPLGGMNAPDASVQLSLSAAFFS